MRGQPGQPLHAALVVYSRASAGVRFLRWDSREPARTLIPCQSDRLSVKHTPFYQILNERVSRETKYLCWCLIFLVIVLLWRMCENKIMCYYFWFVSINCQLIWLIISCNFSLKIYESNNKIKRIFCILGKSQMNIC